MVLWGERVYQWALATFEQTKNPQLQRFVLARRKLETRAEITYYLASAPVGTCLQKIVAVAGVRWTIESCFQSACMWGRSRPIWSTFLALVPSYHIVNVCACISHSIKSLSRWGKKRGNTCTKQFIRVQKEAWPRLSLTLSELRKLLGYLFQEKLPLIESAVILVKLATKT